MLYNLVMVFAIQQCESARRIHISPLSRLSLQPLPLGCHSSRLSSQLPNSHNCSHLWSCYPPNWFCLSVGVEPVDTTKPQIRRRRIYYYLQQVRGTPGSFPKQCCPEQQSWGSSKLRFHAYLRRGEFSIELGQRSTSPSDAGREMPSSTESGPVWHWQMNYLRRHVLTKRLLGRSARDEGSRVREPRRTALPCGLRSRVLWPWG